MLRVPQEAVKAIEAEKVWPINLINYTESIRFQCLLLAEPVWALQGEDVDEAVFRAGNDCLICFVKGQAGNSIWVRAYSRDALTCLVIIEP